MPDFVHLHCHTQYSLLDGATHIPGLMDKALQDGQKGVALSDHGNMFGAFEFVAEANKRGIKPIIGCEFYMVADRHKQSFVKNPTANPTTGFTNCCLQKTRKDISIFPSCVHLDLQKDSTENFLALIKN